MPAAHADDIKGKAASVFGYALNDEMATYGVLTTAAAGDFIDNSAANGAYPSGVIYADIINFDNNENPYLVIFRADAQNVCITTDIFRYDEKSSSAVLVAALSKSSAKEDGVSGEFALGFNDTNRYIVYNEYVNNEKTASQYYTVINGDAFLYVNNPDYAQECGIVSFSNSILFPSVDISNYNLCLDNFFSRLKNAAADSLTYEDISGNIREDEEDKIEAVLTDAARFMYLDIGKFSDISEYKHALEMPDTDNIFYSITHLYNLGEELYYVRFATNHAFYNYAVLRRTQEAENGYQLLAVRTDSIPLSDIEIESLKDAYTHNKLVYKKARGSITGGNEPLVSISHSEIQKPLTMPTLINPGSRKPAGLIGGGICLALIVAFWFVMVSEEEN